MPWLSFNNVSLPTEKSLVGWATSIAINLVFWASIVVPFSRNNMWPISLAASIFYSVCLFLFIRRTHKTIEAGPDGNQESIAGEGEEGQVETISRPPGETSASSLPPGIQPTGSADPLALPGGESDAIAYERDPRGGKDIPSYLSLLYALFALSVGVPGAIIATKAFPCHFDPDGWHNPGNQDKRKPTWKTDTSLLPKAVQMWNQIHKPYDFSAYFYSSHPYAQIDTSDGNASVYFVAAKPNGSKSQLQVVSSGSGPQEIAGFNDPSWLTAVSNQYVCLRETHMMSNDSYSYLSEYSIACGNEALGFNSTERFHVGASPMYLAGIEDLLWFQQVYMKGVTPRGMEGANGYAIVSIDPADVDNMTIHSTLEPPEYHDGDGLCGGDEVVVWLSVPATTCFLFLSALPMVLLSGWFWYQKSISSSSLTLFSSLGLVVGCFCAFGEPSSLGQGFLVWVAIATPIWLFVCSYILAVSPRAARRPLEWFVYTASSVYVVMTTLATIANELDEDFWKYYDGAKAGVVPAAIFNILCVFLPLCLYGIILRSTYVISLGGFGITLHVSNTTFVFLEPKSIPLTAFLILVECLAMFAGTFKVVRAKGHLQKVVVDALRKCTSHLCSRARTEAEMELAESLLLTEETEVRADNNAAGAVI